MTEVHFSRRHMTFAATIQGHADCNVNGSDPICAACSILANTLANHLDDLCNAGYVHGFHAIMCDGYVMVKAKADPHAVTVKQKSPCFGKQKSLVFH